MLVGGRHLSPDWRGAARTRWAQALHGNHSQTEHDDLWYQGQQASIKKLTPIFDYSDMQDMFLLLRLRKIRYRGGTGLLEVTGQGWGPHSTSRADTNLTGRPVLGPSHGSRSVTAPLDCIPTSQFIQTLCETHVTPW